jgi:hypothetical protein
MTAREGRRLAKMSRPSLVLAAGSSAAVAAAAVTGYDFGTAEVAGAVAVAGSIVALNGRGRPEARPHVLSPLPESFGAGLHIAAPTARNLAAQPARRSDAA